MDIGFLLWLQSLRNAALDGIFQVITMFGEEMPLIGAICLLYWCVNKKLAQLMVFNFFMVGLVSQGLKITFCVPRPWVRDPRVLPVVSAQEGATGYSFPSGHTASAVAGYGSVAMYFKKRWVSWVCTALVLLIGLSRLYLGVHAPQDVLASLALGGALLFLTGKLFQRLEERPELDKWVFWGGLLLSVGLLVYAQCKPYPSGSDEKLVLDSVKVAGAAIGLFFGWLFERRVVRFETGATIGRQAAKFLIGMALVGGIMLFKWPLILLGEEVCAVVRYALLAFVAVGGWPYVFQRYLAARQNVNEGRGVA